MYHIVVFILNNNNETNSINTTTHQTYEDNNNRRPIKKIGDTSHFRRGARNHKEDLFSKTNQQQCQEEIEEEQK